MSTGRVVKIVLALTVSISASSSWSLYNMAPFYSRVSRQWTVQDGSANGLGTVQPAAITTDAAGNVYVLADTDTGLNGVPLRSSQDVSIVKYNASGVRQWTTIDGGDYAATLYSRAMAVDASGNVFVAGHTNNQIHGLNTAQASVGFLLKFDSSGVYQWAAVEGAGSNSQSLAIDPSGNVLWLGATSVGLDGQSLIGIQDYFIACYDTHGARQWTIEDGATGGLSYPAGMGVDAGGNIFVGGTQESTGLDGNALLGQEDVFITKYNGSGVRQWTVEDGTAGGNIFADGLVVDSSSHVYLAGNADIGMDGQPASGYWDLVLTKYDASGARQWTTQDSSGSSGVIYNEIKLAIDSAANLYVGGATADVFDGLTPTGGTDLLLTKYNSSGVRQWTVLDGQTGQNYAPSGVAVDGSNNAYLVAGTPVAVHGQTLHGLNDVFFNQYNTSGVLQSTVENGGSTVPNSLYPSGIVVDAAKNVYVVGNTAESMDGQSLPSNEHGYYLTKYDASGNRLWTVVDGGGSPSVAGMVLDSSGNIYVAGATQGNLDGNTLQGLADVFLTKYDPSGTRQWTVQHGSPGCAVMMFSIAMDSSNNFYISGMSFGGGLDGHSLIGYYDMVVVKFNAGGAWQWTVEDGMPHGYTPATAVSADNAGNIFVAGQMDQSGFHGNTLAGFYDYFLSKYDTNGVRQWTVEDGSANNYVVSLSLVTDAGGNAYLFANTDAAMDGQSQINSMYDYILTKYNPAGSRLWTREDGAPVAVTSVGRMAIDGNANIYVTGSSWNIDGQPGIGVMDYFLSKYNAGGTRQWTVTDSAPGGDASGAAIALDNAGGVYLTGTMTGAGLDGQTFHSSGSGMDMFITKY